MSKAITSHRQISKLSGFEMAETFRMDFQDFLSDFQSSAKILDPLLNHIKSASPSTLANFLASANLSKDSIPVLEVMAQKLKTLGDYYDTMNNIQAEEKSLQLDSHQEEIDHLKIELLSLKAQENFLRTQLEDQIQKNAKLEQVHQDKISSLIKGFEETKAGLKEQIDSVNETLREEKMTRKRMEGWFARRLESLQHMVQEMKDKPEKQLDLEKLQQKILRLKKKQPWNKNKPNLILDDGVMNTPKPDLNTSGTATPFSHYVCFFSAAASQDNTINQAFIVSHEHSVNGSMVMSGGNGGQWDHLPKSQREMFENMIKKLNDSNISISEKERLFCGVVKRDASETDLKHVKIEDMLDLSRMSNSKDSLSLDMNILIDGLGGKASQQFNHNIKLGDVKKTGLDQVMSPLLSSIHAKSFLESMKDGIDKSHLSFDQQILLDERKSVIVPEITNRKDEEPQERPSELDKAISNISISEHQIENTDLRKTQDMKSIRDFLSSAREAKEQPKIKDFILSGENQKNENLGNKGPEMDLSMIEKKKENFESKLLERLNASDSFLGDDEIKDFLDKAEEQEFNFTNSNKVLPVNKIEEEPKPSNKNNVTKDLSQMNILDTFKDDPDQKVNESQIRKSTESVISQRKIINDNLLLDTSQNSGHFKRSSAVPSLDFTKIRDRKKPQSVSNLPNNNVNITIINSSMNQSSMLEQRPFEDSEDDESENKKTEKPSEKLPVLKEEKIISQQAKTPIKFQNQRYLEEVEEDSHGKKPYYPRRSIDFLPKPPGLPKQARSNFSLLEEMTKHATINNTSFEQKGPVKKGHQLHTSMYSLPGETSFDNSMIKKSNDFGKKSSDYKNNRNSRSFQLQRNEEGGKPMSQAAKALGILIGKNTHTSHIRQMTEMSPSTKAQGEHPYNYKGPHFHDKQHSLQINYTHLFNKSGPQDISNPPSYESTQVGPKGLIAKEELEGSNPLKKVLTYEDSKMYPTPQKPPKREFSRRIHNENFNGLNVTKDEESSIMGKGLRDKKPMSPSKDEKSKIMNQSVTTGGGHFRMKRFNVKKL